MKYCTDMAYSLIFIWKKKHFINNINPPFGDDFSPTIYGKSSRMVVVDAEHSSGFGRNCEFCENYANSQPMRTHCLKNTSRCRICTSNPSKVSYVPIQGRHFLQLLDFLRILDHNWMVCGSGHSFVVPVGSQFEHAQHRETVIFLSQPSESTENYHVYFNNKTKP